LSFFKRHCKRNWPKSWLKKWVSANPQFQPQPLYPPPSIHDIFSSFFADTENLFAVEARICNLSLEIEPVKILYTESKAHRLDKQLLCSHLNPLSAFQPERDSQNEADTRPLAFVSPLKRWVDYALSTTKQKKLLHFESLSPSRRTAFP
jgi:hypothetical protein